MNVFWGAYVRKNNMLHCSGREKNQIKTIAYGILIGKKMHHISLCSHERLVFFILSFYEVFKLFLLLFCIAHL